MKQERPKNGRKLLYIIAVLLGLMAGCAGPQLTPEQVTQINVECNDDATCIIEATDKAMADLLVQLEYEAEDRRIQKRDKLIAFLNACDASSKHILVETRKAGSSNFPNDRQRRAARKEYGHAFTHDNVNKRARRHEMSCVTYDELREAFCRAGYC